MSSSLEFLPEENGSEHNSIGAVKKTEASSDIFSSSYLLFCLREGLMDEVKKIIADEDILEANYKVLLTHKQKKSPLTLEILDKMLKLQLISEKEYERHIPADSILHKNDQTIITHCRELFRSLIFLPQGEEDEVVPNRTEAEKMLELEILSLEDFYQYCWEKGWIADRKEAERILELKIVSNEAFNQYCWEKNWVQDEHDQVFLMESKNLIRKELYLNIQNRKLTRKTLGNLLEKGYLTAAEYEEYCFQNGWIEELEQEKSDKHFNQIFDQYIYFLKKEKVLTEKEAEDFLKRKLFFEHEYHTYCLDKGWLERVPEDMFAKKFKEWFGSNHTQYKRGDFFDGNDKIEKHTHQINLEWESFYKNDKELKILNEGLKTSLSAMMQDYNGGFIYKIFACAPKDIETPMKSIESHRREIQVILEKILELDIPCDLDGIFHKAFEVYLQRLLSNFVSPINESALFSQERYTAFKNIIDFSRKIVSTIHQELLEQAYNYIRCRLSDENKKYSSSQDFISRSNVMIRSIQNIDAHKIVGKQLESLLVNAGSNPLLTNNNSLELIRKYAEENNLDINLKQHRDFKSIGEFPTACESRIQLAKKRLP